MTIIILIWLRSMMLALDCLFFFGLLVLINGGVPSLTLCLVKSAIGRLGLCYGCSRISCWETWRYEYGQISFRHRRLAVPTNQLSAPLAIAVLTNQLSAPLAIAVLTNQLSAPLAIAVLINQP
ncbi:hypothetical protein [Fructobacillus tropaeoli]|uniref:hypothetical protein n=1 Tax=Fructobacillus tropaeoli TaxID=709323 RepID=UPI0030C8D3A2